MYGSSKALFLKAVHTLLCSTVSKAFSKLMAATHSGWCHSVALYRICWSVYRWSVVEQPGLEPAWSAVWLSSRCVVDVGREVG